MKGNEFLSNLENIDADLIEQSAQQRRTVWNRAAARWAFAAAGLALVLGAAAMILLLPHGSENSPGNTAMQGAVSEQDGVYIEPLTLPESTQPGVAMDMIGLIVYKGCIYTQAEYIQCSNDQKDAFAGEYLGRAIGNIDEWSTQDEYATEFASNIAGDVYSVKGYDPAFRICIKELYEGCEFISFFENLNGITLRTGSDLYGDRLGLAENYESVTWQSHSNWDNAVETYHPLEVPAQTLADFLTELYAAPFVDLGEAGYYIFDTKQTHLWFKMKDGTTVGLRLFEDGYVRYQNMSGGCVVVSMPGDTLTTMLDACSQ